MITMSLNSLQILSNVLSVTTHHEINIVDGHLKQALILVPDLNTVEYNHQLY